MVNIKQTHLPGIGEKYQVVTNQGDKLVIVIHDDGNRELYHFVHDDPETSISMITLDDDEARQIAGIVGGMNYKPKELETVDFNLDDLVIEWVKIESGCSCVGKTIGELAVRQNSGATIIAIIGADRKQKINPGPEDVFMDKSTVVVAGERSQVKALKQLLR